MLPSPFPKLLLWSPAGGVTPQAEKRWPVPRRGWRTARLALLRHKKRPVTTTGRFALAGWGTGQAVFPPLCTMASTWGSRGLRSKGQEEDCGTPLSPAQRMSRREEPGQELTRLLSSGGPSSEDGDLHADRKKRFWKGGGKADQGRPAGPCPLRRRKLRASRAGWREDLFPEKVSLPLSFPFESDVTTYSCARPMPGRAASRPAPRRKRPASSKALPMSCMPTGILLSAAMPTGRDRPGRPARFRDRG